MKFPSFSQWKQIFNVLKKSEKIALLVFSVLAAGSLIFLLSNFYINNTSEVPAFGGTYVEGVVGQPRFINPIYGETNDVDRSLIDLVFSGLMTYDKQGNIVPDLIDTYTVSSDGKTYTFTLKNNLAWHDQRPLTADDVIFTIKTIQNSDYKSPLRANWVDVDAQKISDRSFSFTLKRPYSSFLENCTVKIIPQHIWQNISPENFTLSLYNLQPIGAGPFAFTRLSQTKTGFIQTLQLDVNRQYFGKIPFISSVSFSFFETMDSLMAAAGARQINGFALGTLDKNADDIENQIKPSWAKAPAFNEYAFALPRYFAVFFNNQKTSLFSDPNIRKAMTFAVNKEELLKNISAQSGIHVSPVDSPTLPDFYGSQPPASMQGFDVQKATSLLDKAGFKTNTSGRREKAVVKKPAFQFKSYLKPGSSGTEVVQLQACLARLDDSFSAQGGPALGWKTLLASETNGKYGKGTEDAVTQFQKKYLPAIPTTGETGPGTRQKLNELCVAQTPNSLALAFTLTTIDQPQLLAAANALKAYWENVGISVTINPISISDLKPIIKNRDYDALLYGQALGMQPDLYPFWYSSQKQDPGLNLSSYENKDIDALLKDARETMDAGKKQQDLEKIQTLILGDAPALFLYNPDYLYWVSEKVQGVDTAKIADPAKRFANINNWYTQTKRVWK